MINNLKFRVKHRKRKKVRVRVKEKKNKIKINMSECKYAVVKFVAKKINKWRLQYDSEATDWDVMWTDNFVRPEQLSKM